VLMFALPAFFAAKFSGEDLLDSGISALFAINRPDDVA
jgi:hypothetical protein